jgi:hypothetical protein
MRKRLSFALVRGTRNKFLALNSFILELKDSAFCCPISGPPNELKKYL